MADETSGPCERDVQGLKYLDKPLPLLDRSLDVGCQHDRAGSRKPHYDQYCMLVLLFLFNPTLRSLRALQQPSAKKGATKVGISANFAWLALRGHRRS
jgi:hypothetical protein